MLIAAQSCSRECGSIGQIGILFGEGEGISPGDYGGKRKFLIEKKIKNKTNWPAFIFPLKLYQEFKKIFVKYSMNNQILTKIQYSSNLILNIG